MSCIRIVNARTHNLQGVTLELPHNQLTVITGVSGSGKSSLAIDTLFAEGQRQYIESLSTYARQFLHQLQRPEVESIDGLQPTLCIDQKVGSTNPRSTVATVTEAYDYLRLLMARVGVPSCYACGQPIIRQSPDQIQADLLALPDRTKIVLMAPVVRGRRGSHGDALSNIRKAGLVKVRVDGELFDIDDVPQLSVRKTHSIEAVVDKLVLREGCETRLADSIDTALRLASGLVSASYLAPAADQVDKADDPAWSERLFSTLYACASCGVSYEELEPRTFSFNSPYGACPACDGVGKQMQLDPESLIPNWSAAPAKGAFRFLVKPKASSRKKLQQIARAALDAVGGDWADPLSKLSQSKRRQLLHGSPGQDGLLSLLKEFRDSGSSQGDDLLSEFLQPLDCSACGGARLRSEALSVRLFDRNIHDICSVSIQDALAWFQSLKFDAPREPIAKPIITEMLHRLRFLNQVGVGYLTLARAADSLSGGELQRVRLATSIGSGLVGVCYILDEPSIGLHQRDNDRLIASLRDLQRQGNTVIVVEHDEAMMRAADCLVDVGPGAGDEGGRIVCVGKPGKVEAHPESLTARYLRGDELVGRPSELRRPGRKRIRLKSASLHNLRRVDLELPLGLLVGVTGVSGSGKSSLIGKTLVPALAKAIGQRVAVAGPHRSLSGYKYVDKLIEITQAPIGRSPRSTPATYCGVFDLIRTVFAQTRESKRRGFTASRFSFNAGDGRCSLCQGQGQEKIEMNFLPDLYVTCSICGGRRFNRQTLQVKFRDKSVFNILEMSVSEATDFFENFSKIHRLLHSLESVGLGYLSLGQSSSTLSGGESQRIKLATELAKQETGNTIYFLDEPTSGLHFADVNRLIGVLDGLVSRGNTVIVIEHNLDVIKSCDWLIDLGPEGGDGGGEIVAVGSPAEVAQVDGSLTGHFLRNGA